jgi:ABC-type sulfate/molybdate transport systems ATPase subunit
VNDPAVLLLDEPFRGLDRHLRDALVQRVRRLVRTRKRTVVIATHDIDEVWPVADLLAVIEGGVIAQVDRPEQVYRHPATMNALQLTGDHLPFYSAVADGAAQLADEPAWARPDSVTVRPVNVPDSRGQREPDGEIVVPATLTGVRQTGPNWQYDVIYPDGRAVSWRSATAPTATPGRVEVAVPVASLLRPQPRATDPEWPEPDDGSDHWVLDVEPDDGRGRPALPLTGRAEILDSRANR